MILTFVDANNCDCYNKNIDRNYINNKDGNNNNNNNNNDNYNKYNNNKNNDN